MLAPMGYANYLTPKAENRPLPRAGTGSFAVEPIAAGETVAVFGGSVVTRAELDALASDRQSRSIQLDDSLYLASAEMPEPGDMVNHSCAPNCGMQGSTIVVAMRDIHPGEELTFDYAMSDGSDYDEFECSCGAPQCRGKVTGHDWMLPELQLAYRGFFSPYLANRISSLVHVGSERRAFAY
jgi:SET domain-containing protein